MSFRVAAGVYLVAAIALGALVPEASFYRFFPDDAFFYVKTAQNIAAGLGSTFDGVNATNGYHPLWMVFLVVAALLPVEGTSLLRTVILLHALFVVLSTWLTLAFLRLGGPNPRRDWLVALASFAAVGFTDVGMEVPVLLASGWAFLVCAARFGDGSSRRDQVMLALTVAAVCLARVDALLLVLSVVGARVMLSGPRRSLRFVAATLIPAGLTVVGVAGHNTLRFGHASSISASLKTAFPGTFASGWLWDVATRGVWARMGLVATVGLVSITAVLVTLRRERRSATPMEMALVGANAYGMLHVLAVTFGSVGGVGSWYFALSASVALATAGLLLARGVGRLTIPASLGRALVAAGTLALAMIAGSFVQHRLSQTYYVRANLALAKWLRTHLAPGDRAFQVDGTGLVAYASERAIINGDGLINGWEYQRYLRSNRLFEYLRDKQVSLVITHMRSSVDPGAMEMQIPLWNAPPVRVATLPADRARFIAGPYAVYDAAELFGSTTLPEPVLTSTASSQYRWRRR